MRKHAIISDSEAPEARELIGDEGFGYNTFAAPLVDKNENAPVKFWGLDWKDMPQEIIDKLSSKFTSFKHFDASQGTFEENIDKEGLKKKPKETI